MTAASLQADGLWRLMVGLSLLRRAAIDAGWGLYGVASGLAMAGAGSLWRAALWTRPSWPYLQLAGLFLLIAMGMALLILMLPAVPFLLLAAAISSGDSSAPATPAPTGPTASRRSQWPNLARACLTGLWAIVSWIGIVGGGVLGIAAMAGAAVLAIAALIAIGAGIVQLVGQALSIWPWVLAGLATATITLWSGVALWSARLGMGATAPVLPGGALPPTPNRTQIGLPARGSPVGPDLSGQADLLRALAQLALLVALWAVAVAGLAFGVAWLFDILPRIDWGKLAIIVLSAAALITAIWAAIRFAEQIPWRVILVSLASFVAAAGAMWLLSVLLANMTIPTIDLPPIPWRAILFGIAVCVGVLVALWALWAIVSSIGLAHTAGLIALAFAGWLGFYALSKIDFRPRYRGTVELVMPPDPPALDAAPKQLHLYADGVAGDVAWRRGYRNSAQRLSDGTRVKVLSSPSDICNARTLYRSDPPPAMALLFGTRDWRSFEASGWVIGRSLRRRESVPRDRERPTSSLCRSGRRAALLHHRSEACGF